jgi:nuclear mRNA export protein PCID2/THP1
LLQRAFTSCLNERSANNTAKTVEGKKKGIYIFANLVCKLLFRCKRTRLAAQMFSNIAGTAPALAAYPAAQRVTYLYYLGRFAFHSNHFTRAQLCLDKAYKECHVQAAQQARGILTYLITTNLILGRFPSHSLLSRPEARGLAERFLPLCNAIRQGNLASFNSILESPENKVYFLRMGIYLPLRNRCEVLLWRGLARRIFVLAGSPGGEKAAPTFELRDLLHIAQLLSKSTARSQPLGLLNGNAQREYVDPDLVDPDSKQPYRPSEPSPSMMELECIISSLIDQGLLRGYVAHKQLRFAIMRGKKRDLPPQQSGFPNVYQTLVVERQKEWPVPGWVPPEAGVNRGIGSGPARVSRINAREIQ